MHIHLHDFKDPLDAVSTPKTLLVAVSEDLESLTRTVELSRSYDNVVPCAGYHPWKFKGGGSLEAALEVVREAYRLDLHCIGEVGLDKRFVPPSTLPLQVEVLRAFLEFARETGSYVTLHSPDAWREVLSLLVEEGVERAMFHWYTGPLTLIDEIVSRGYHVSINPAVAVQEKHARVAAYTPLSHMVFESDAPYVYKGLALHPRLIPESASIVARLKGVSVEAVTEAAAGNSRRLLQA